MRFIVTCSVLCLLFLQSVLQLWISVYRGWLRAWLLDLVDETHGLIMLSVLSLGAETGPIPLTIFSLHISSNTIVMRAWLLASLSVLQLLNDGLRWIYVKETVRSKPARAGRVKPKMLKLLLIASKLELSIQKWSSRVCRTEVPSHSRCGT
jgi:hypothetical protein